MDSLWSVEFLGHTHLLFGFEIVVAAAFLLELLLSLPAFFVSEMFKMIIHVLLSAMSYLHSTRCKCWS